jgi:chromosome segregation ATPase
MSNSNRNPKNLREFVDKSKIDYGEFDKINGGVGLNDVDESLKNLRNLSHEEKTEIGMLKSRVDEQSRLIMTLKQRADDFIRKNMTIEKLNHELQEQNESYSNEIRQADAKYNDLLDKFNYLGNNHEQLIVIKDEYKHKNEELVAKNKMLIEKFKNAPNESEFLAEKMIMQEKLDNLSKKYVDLEFKYLGVCNDNEKKINQLIEEANNLKREKQKTEELKGHLKDLHDKCEEFKTRNKGN